MDNLRFEIDKFNRINKQHVSYLDDLDEIEAYTTGLYGAGKEIKRLIEVAKQEVLELLKSV